MVWYRVDNGTVAHDADMTFALDSDNAHAVGVTRTTNAYYVVDRTDAKVYAYHLDGTRNSAKDFALDALNDAAQGITHTSSGFFVADATDRKVYAYTTSGARDATKDFSLGTTTPGGIAANATNFYIVDSSNTKVSAYSVSSRTKDASVDFNTIASASGIGVTSDRIFVANNSTPRTLQAYTLTGTRSTADDITQTTNNTRVDGLVVTDDGYFTLDLGQAKVYVYSTTDSTQYDIVADDATLASGDCQATSASETDEYVCLYTVGNSDAGTLGVSVGSASTDLSANPYDAVYVHSDTVAMDNVAPTVTSGTKYYSNSNLSAASELVSGSYRKQGETVYTKLVFSEDVAHTKSDGSSARPEVFYRIGSTDTQYDILNNADTLAHGDCKPTSSSATDEYICMYTTPASTDGTFTVKVGTDTTDIATNALASTYTNTNTITLDGTAPTYTAADGLLHRLAGGWHEDLPELG